MTNTANMSLSPDLLLGLLNRPIAFHRVFVDLTGSVTAALLLSQAMYWQSRLPPARDGWWYKSRDDWQRETGLARREQESARKRLRELNILEEDRAGVPARLWYRIDLRRLAVLLSGLPVPEPGGGVQSDEYQGESSVGTIPPNWLVRNEPSSGYESARLDGTNPPIKKGGIRPTYTETTTESTHTRAAAAAPAECVFDNAFEESAWRWAQEHDFWSSRITSPETLRRNLQPHKAFHRQVGAALRGAVKRSRPRSAQERDETSKDPVESPGRPLSPLWRQQRDQLMGHFSDTREQGYLMAIKATEDDRSIWLETPNRFVEQWLKSNLPAIRPLLEPAGKVIKVCLG